MVALISDLYESPEAGLEAVKPLRARGQEVMVFLFSIQMSPRTSPFADAAQFEDMERGIQLSVNPGQLRESYRSEMQLHLDSLTRLFRQNQIDYSRHDTISARSTSPYLISSPARERFSRTR